MRKKILLQKFRNYFIKNKSIRLFYLTRIKKHAIEIDNGLLLEDKTFLTLENLKALEKFADNENLFNATLSLLSVFNDKGVRIYE